MYILKKIALFAVTLSQLVPVGCAPTPSEDIKTSELQRRGARYPSVDQRLFNFGKTQYFAGMLLSSLEDVPAPGLPNPSTSTDVYFQVLNSTGQYFNYNTRNGIARLDYAIAAAEQYGIKLILPLLNNFDDLGGINTYTNVYGGTHQGFYTNIAAQNAYKKYIKFIVQRYKSSSAIFSWELCNEPRCSGCDPSVITKWATDISAYIKSLDKNHMVSLGDEGWLTSTSSYVPNFENSYAYSGYEGVDFEKILAIPTIDYGTFHLYPNYWGYNYSWGNTWIEQHNAIGKKAGKPVLLEEYAVPDGEDRLSIMGAWQDTVINKTSVAGDMMWQLGVKFPSGAQPLDNFAVFYGSSEYQVLGNQHAKAMTAKKGTVSALVATG
ncbi:MAG: hypothetical protein Q9201_002535 [Fulgogasparrea decipioides]